MPASEPGEPIECPACGYEIAPIRLTDPGLAPVIAHLRAEAERRRDPARTRDAFWRRAEASALERAAEILSRHV